MKSKKLVLVSMLFMFLESCTPLQNIEINTSCHPDEMRVYKKDLSVLDSLKVSYLEETDDLPYCSLNAFVSFYDLLKENNPKLPEYEVQGNILRNNYNDTYLEVDTSLKRLTFSNFDEFATFNEDYSIYYPTYDTDHKNDENDMRYTYYSHISVHQEDDKRVVSLKDYEIHTFVKDEEVYLPLSFYLDFILYPLEETFVLGNSSVFELDFTSWYNEMGNAYSTEYWMYYKNDFASTSQARLDYNNQETRLALDLAYGQNRTSSTLKASTTIEEAEHHLADYIYEDLNELHSSYVSPSPYQVSSYEGFYNLKMKTSDFLNEKQEGSEVFTSYRDLYSSLYSLRNKDTKAFEIKDDTAYITFDTFKGATKDYYDESNIIDETNYDKDTISLMSYSYNQIKKNPNIKNVVFDVSLNTGGEIAAMVYAVGLFAKKTDFYSKNFNTNSEYHFSLHSDADFDGKMDEPIIDKNIYVLSSGVSFSCGNSFISLMKESGKATIVGQSSAGGASSVRYMLSPLGSQYRISSNEVMCDSSFHNLESGISPDIQLNYQSFYDNNLNLTN